MPICSVEVPSRNAQVKNALVKRLTEAMKAAFKIDGEYVVFIREYAPSNASYNGALEEAFPPICFVECPELNVTAKSVLVKQMSDALVAAYDWPNPMIFLRNYPLDNVAKGGILHSQNPRVTAQLEALKA